MQEFENGQLVEVSLGGPWEDRKYVGPSSEVEFYHVVEGTTHVIRVPDHYIRPLRRTVEEIVADIVHVSRTRASRYGGILTETDAHTFGEQCAREALAEFGVNPDE